MVEWRLGITCERVEMGLWVDEGNGVGGVCVVCQAECCSAMQLTPLLAPVPANAGLGGIMILPRAQLQKALRRNIWGTRQAAN